VKGKHEQNAQNLDEGLNVRRIYFNSLEHLVGKMERGNSSVSH